MKSSSPGASKQAKTVASAFTVNGLPSSLNGLRNHPTPAYAINKYELQSVEKEHINRYDLVASCKIIEPKYIDYNMLESLSSLNDLNELIEVAWCIDFVKWDKPIYERSC